ncbi:hypothetical protein SLA2020_338790 [Shorea laevis]
MAEAWHVLSARNIVNPTPSPFPAKTKSLKLASQSLRIRASSKRNGFSRTPRRLITISPSDGRWHGKWTCDYHLSLRDLRLQDLVEGEHKNAEVFVKLCIDKHASFGLSVDGRILTSFTRNCSICSSPYCREIDTNFNVWVLPPSRENSANQLPEIGGDDPSLTELDSLVQETILLTISIKDTCSELCERSEPTLQYAGGQKVCSPDKRWSRLLELKNANHNLHM